MCLYGAIVQPATLLSACKVRDRLAPGPRGDIAMKAALAGLVALALVFSSAPACLAGDNASLGKVISEGEARIISARLYSAVLIRACKNGWRYPLSRVKSGFKRHFEEFKLQLANSGYVVVPNRSGDGARKQPRISTVVVNDHIAPRFGCARKYWLDE